jgi:hypothetical protein
MTPPLVAPTTRYHACTGCASSASLIDCTIVHIRIPQYEHRSSNGADSSDVPCLANLRSQEPLEVWERNDEDDYFNDEVCVTSVRLWRQAR